MACVLTAAQGRFCTILCTGRKKGKDIRKVRADKDTYNYLVPDTGPSFYRGFRERNELAESHTVSGKGGHGSRAPSSGAESLSPPPAASLQPSGDTPAPLAPRTYL